MNMGALIKHVIMLLQQFHLLLNVRTIFQIINAFLIQKVAVCKKKLVIQYQLKMTVLKINMKINVIGMHIIVIVNN